LKTTYVDKALLVASLVHEPGTDVAHWIRQQASGLPWLISTWVETELASALTMQCRRGTISPHERDEAWARFQEHLAVQLCLAEAPPRRAGDALDVAVCLWKQCRLASFDQGLWAAAAHHGVAGELLRIRV